MTTVFNSQGETPHSRDTDGYEALARAVSSRFRQLANNGLVMFTTHTPDLFKTFLRNLPQGHQHYNCRACEHFIDKYGGLVFIDSTGAVKSAMWLIGEPPQFFIGSIAAMLSRLRNAEITGVFLTTEVELGHRHTNGWNHFAVEVPSRMRYSGSKQQCNEAIAKIRERFGMLTRHVQKYNKGTVEVAIALLSTQAAYRGNQHLPRLEWLLKVINDVELTNTRNRVNKLWHYAAVAPAGWVNVGASVIGTVLDNISTGLSGDSIVRKYNEMMNPTQYRRPSALPAEQTVLRAEALALELGLESALKRRFARLSEITWMWEKTNIPTPRRRGGTAFSNVPTRDGRNAAVSKMELPSETMTWMKFERTLLPKTYNIGIHIPYDRLPFTAITTATDPNSEPILQWDRRYARNPFSWYMYAGGSTSTQWNIEPGRRDVCVIAASPSVWRDYTRDNFANSRILILRGARDTQYRSAGLGLFPEILRSELHEVRKVIEQHSRQGVISGYPYSTACGLAISATGKWNPLTLLVSTQTTIQQIYIDRWD